MKKKLSAKDTKLLLLSYNYVFKPMQEENGTLQQEVNELIMQESQLKLMDSQKTTYQNKIDEMQGEIETLIADYPPELRQEDALAYAISLEEQQGISISSIDFGENTLFYELGENDLYQQSTTYTFTGTYQQVKDTIAKIQADKEKKNITALTLGYGQEDGGMIGTITVNQFALDQTGKEYQEPKNKAVQEGKQNLFDSK